MALIARDLGYVYGAGTSFTVRALEGVSLSVGAGDLLVIAGTTGSGKSTLLRMLAGLLEPEEGAVEVDGHAPTDRLARGLIALVFQNPESQFFAETVATDVAFGPRNLGAPDPHEAARSALTAVGLDPDVFGGRSPFTLSGGEARRAAIAGALAMRSPYLLLDEPTAGLDLVARTAVLAAIESERERAGVVVVTHDPAEFLPSATRVLALDGGRAAFAGTVDELLDSSERYVAAGLQLPEVVRAQLLARERGALLPRPVFGPAEAADALLTARSVSR